MKFIWHHNTWPWGRTVRIISADGTPCVGFSILILTKEPQNYIGGEVERMFFGRALYVSREIHTLQTYNILMDVIDNLVRMKAWDKPSETEKPNGDR